MRVLQLIQFLSLFLIFRRSVEMSGFEELGLMPELVRAVEDIGWYLPRPVQQEAIPLILGGGHVMCAAETGSGKTGAFSLPIIQVTWEALNRRAGQRAAPRCVINTEDCTPNCKVSVDGLLCQCHDQKGWSGSRCTYGVKEGKWYYEATVVESGGIIRVGWSTLQGGLELGKDSFGFGYGGTGKKSFNNTFEDYGGTFDKGDTIGCALDLTGDGNVTFYKNGVSLGTAFKSIPSALKGESFHPAICIKCSQVRLTCSKTQYLPKGFRCIDDAKGPEQDAIAAEFQRRRNQRGVVGPTCIVVEPTLELVQQVVDETVKFAKYLDNPPVKLSAVIGKRTHSEILGELKRGANVVVGTPGRMESFIDSGQLSLENVQFLIMDEADRFAAENFNFVVKLHQKIPSTAQVAMFSATLHSPEILELAEKICPKATWVDLKGKEYIPETVHHGVVYVDADEAVRKGTFKPSPNYTTDGVHYEEKKHMKGDTEISEVTKMMKPQVLLKIIDAYKMEQCMIFCRTRLDCDLLSAFLTAEGGNKQVKGKTEKGKENPYSNVVLHSGFSASDRAIHLQLFKEGDARFLICTDVAARGIDIQALPYVINMTLPDKSEDYVHRIGRTGRADRMGLAISIVSRHKEKVWYHTCPSKGEGCYNTDLAHPDKNRSGRMTGGCCIWFDEPKCAAAIQERLKKDFDELDPKTFRYHVKGADETAVSYGRSREEARRVASAQDAQRLSQVQSIAIKEKDLQALCVSNKHKLAALLEPAPDAAAKGSKKAGK